MSKPLRILIIEDSEDDTWLLIRELRRGGYDMVFERVETSESMKEALAKQEWDVIISDHLLPRFSGPAALEILKGTGLDLPFIIVSGTIGEDVAVAGMKSGAHDYIMKGNLKRLVPAVEREIREAEIRRARQRAEERLKESEKQLRHLSAELLRAQERERKRIAGELHDSVAASLSAVKVGIEKILGQIAPDGGAQAGLSHLVSTLQQAIEETRRIMYDLRPSILDDLGVIPAIHWLCREFQKTYSQVSIAQQLDIEEDDIPDDLKTPIFRILQEALNNIAKHSQASLVNLSLQKNARGIALNIRDNGRGFDLAAMRLAEDLPRGLGLVSMKERAELSGGLFTIDSAAGVGTGIWVSWPRPQESNHP